MFSPDDTIVAIATPPGRGGIGVVRVSGRDARRIATSLLARGEPLEPRRATFARLAPADGSSPPGPPRRGVGPQDTGDEVVVTFFPCPRSYTGEDVVEISAHGSPIVLRGIVERGVAAGARLAEPGEFTLRAFLNGKRDLVQAEAVGDLIAAVTPLQARTAFDQLQGTLTERIRQIDTVLFEMMARLEASLDFADEGYHFIEPASIAEGLSGIMALIDALLDDAQRGRMIRDGATVVIAGRPNVGKSSLFNALAGADRAIVTAVPGTTRDLVTETVDIAGLAVTLVDTAGIRETLDAVEREGVTRGDRARAVADLVLVVLDASQPLADDDLALLDQTAAARRVVVLNKSDRSGRYDFSRVTDAVSVSAVTFAGLSVLRARIAGGLGASDLWRDTAALSNTRHIGLLRSARAHLESARAAARELTPEEFVLADVQAARQEFDELVGRRTTEDLLAHIFERFCIGK